MTSEYSLGIIGVGQIGSRHLQALALIDRSISIQVVDPFPESLVRAKERFDEIKGSGNVKKVEFLNNISDMSSELDLVIVATTAGVRRQVVETLLTRKQVNYLLLEKVLFQRLNDFSAINSLLDHHNVKTWVNFTRRAWPIYQELQEKMKSVNSVSLNVIGSKWGLGCNGLHYIDLFAYLTGNTEIKLLSDLLDPEVIPTKRQGHLEFTGTLRGSSERNNHLTLTSYSTGEAKFFVQITSPTERFLIYEENEIAWISEEKNEWKCNKRSFSIPYQSQLTHLVAQQILDTGQCSLTSYEDAWKFHVPFIETLLTHLLQKSSFKEADRCPIT
ncbi:MAG: Gfo/Idh/MocA family oxidoreductase [Candidatus Hodarchaeales archaeon]